MCENVSFCYSSADYFCFLFADIVDNTYIFSLYHSSIIYLFLVIYLIAGLNFYFWAHAEMIYGGLKSGEFNLPQNAETLKI